MARVKIPKRVAGVKIPKKMRKKANKAIRLVESPVAREMAAAAVGAAATRANAPAAAAMRTALNDPDRFVDTLTNAALEGFRRFLEGFEEGLRKAADPAGEETEAVAEAKPNGSASERAAAD